MANWVARADEAGAWVEERPGKRVALLDLTVKRSWEKENRDFRLVVRLIERTIDPKGQVLLFPEYRLEGWWASLGAKPVKVIELYREHATHEQFHSEIKSDLDLECLPSGQVRLQRPRAAPGDAGLQLPAPRRPDRPGSA